MAHARPVQLGGEVLKAQPAITRGGAYARAEILWEIDIAGCHAATVSRFP
jgi:hypothetical protein